MKELVFRSERGNPVTTSLLVAEKFGKNHAHVLRDIENLSCSMEFRESNFGLSSYTSQQNKQLPMYIMTKDGFTFLAMGYTGEVASKFKEDYINAFNKMEQAIKNMQLDFSNPETVLKLAQNWADEQRKRIEAEKVIEEQKPKVVFADAVTGSNTNILVRDLAKLIQQNGYQIGEIRLYDWMVANKYLSRTQRWSNKKQRFENDYMPTQKASDLKVFFVTKQVIVVGDLSFTKHTVKVTGKGTMYFINKFIGRDAS